MSGLISSDCCNKPLRFDPDYEGVTCGGLALRGWDICTDRGVAWISKRGVVASSSVRIARGRNSVEIDGLRVRIEAAGNGTPQREAIQALIKRIAALPELERAVLGGCACPARAASEGTVA